MVQQLSNKENLCGVMVLNLNGTKHAINNGQGIYSCSYGKKASLSSLKSFKETVL